MFRFAIVFGAAVVLASCGYSSGTTQTSAPLLPAGSSGLIAGRTGPSISYFGPPNGFEWPEYITVGPDHNLWFTEFYSEQIVRMTATGSTTVFNLPANNDVEAIISGPDGNLWFTEPGANQIGRMTTSGVVTAFALKDPNSSPRGICVGPDGNLWFAEYQGDAIGRITPDGKVTEFSEPGQSTSPWEIIAGTDGIMYVTDSTSDDIARFDPTTLRWMPQIALPIFDNPWALAIGPDKNVWFTGRHAGVIGEIVNGKPNQFRIGAQGAYPDDLALGPDGLFYITDSLRNSISRFNPATHTFLPRMILNTADIPTAVVAGPDGNMWFTVPSYTSQFNRIGRINLR